MNLQELAAFLGFTYEAAKNIIRTQSDFPIVKIGNQNRFLKEQVLDWIRKKQTTRGEISKANQAAKAAKAAKVANNLSEK